MLQRRSAQICLTIFCFMIGLGLIMQLRTQNRTVKEIQAQSSVDQAQVVSNLIDGNAALSREIRDLEGQLSSFKQTSGGSDLDTLVNELNRMKVINGSVEVAGPGINVKLDGRLTVLDMQDVINELRNAGAEALSLNGQRIIVSTVVQEDQDGLIVDDVRVNQPYILTALGNADTLERAVDRKGGVLQILGYNYPNASITVNKSVKLVVPIYQGKFGITIATIAK